MKNYFISLSILLFFCQFSFAQTSRIELLPQINGSYALNSNWRIFARVEPRFLFYRNFRSDYKYERTDFLAMASRKIAADKNITVGYLIRHRDGNPVQMLLQQFSFISKFENFRLAHRLATDQTFGRSLETTLRLRYRIGVELALQGSILDTKEFFVRFSNEYNSIFRKSGYNMVIRFYAGMGYVFNENMRIEMGLDYRMGNIIQSPVHSFLLNPVFLVSF